MTVDVAVVGGGSAGLAAACSAASTGAKTLLIERSGMLGGIASLSLVHSICGLYRLDSNGEYANEGFPVQFAEALIAMGGASGPVRMGRLDVLMHDPAAFAICADRMTAKYSNLETALHCDLVAADLSSDQQRIDALHIAYNGKLQSVEPHSVIDCSGDAVLAEHGAANQMVDLQSLQRPAYIFKLAGFESEKYSDNFRLQLAHALMTAVRDKRLPRTALGASVRRGIHADELFVTVDLEAEGFDPASRKSLTQVEQHGRMLAHRLTAFLRQNIDGFSNAFLAQLPARVGIRESRRHHCRYMLNENDITSGRQFDDAVAEVSWPIELRERATGPKFRFAEDANHGQIPLRSLQSSNIQNLYCAGRCVGSTHVAQASIRVIGSSMATGQAAGLAAVASSQVVNA